jgi:hypothetical protein
MPIAVAEGAAMLRPMNRTPMRLPTAIDATVIAGAQTRKRRSSSGTPT